jgi:putative SOS response-associated peptidase YedK
MCGRFAITLPPDAMRSFFGYVEQPNFPPRYNIAPTQPVPIICASRDKDGHLERHFRLVRWGFLPHFVKDPKLFPLIINARGETLSSKASFRAAFKRRRCVFMADAFYEWQRAGDTNRPHIVYRRDGRPLAFAGLWETWAGPNGEEQDTACIVTTAANCTTAVLHDRLPVILEPATADLWLDPDEAMAESAASLLKPPDNEVLDFFEIGPLVNKVGNDSSDVQLPVQPTTRSCLAANGYDRLTAAQGRLF